MYKRQVLIPSKFGYGHSGLTDAPRDVDTVVEEYRGVLAALERPLPVVLAAHSMGFLEALHWARKYPEEVSALVGLDPAVPQVYQHMELDAVHRRLEDLHRSSWKRGLLFRLTSRALLKRFPASERRELAQMCIRDRGIPVDTAHLQLQSKLGEFFRHGLTHLSGQLPHCLLYTSSLCFGPWSAIIVQNATCFPTQGQTMR